MNRPVRVLASFWIVLAAIGLYGTRLLAAELSIPMVIAPAGQAVASSVQYSAQRAKVSAFVFDLAFDTSALKITATAGSALTAAGKSLAQAVQPNGNIRFVIFGLNQNVIEDGSLIDLQMTFSADSRPGAYDLNIVNLSAADPDANAVSVSVRGSRIIRRGPP